MRDRIDKMMEENDEFKNYNRQDMISETSLMEKILDNPGLVHLAENIFGNLYEENLEVCVQINQSSKQIVTNPIFYLRKFTALSKDNQNDWMKVLKSVKNSEKEKAIISYLQWNLKNTTASSSTKTLTWWIFQAIPVLPDHYLSHKRKF